MGCQSAVRLGEDLPVSICTHDPDTGELTDADADPLYRVYEEGGAAPVLTGTMSLFDAANTTGFYLVLLPCTVANSFETGKGYTVYIEATVDGDTGGICYGFRVGNSTLAEEVWAHSPRTLTMGAVSVISAVTGSTINIIRGDSLSASITGLGDISTRTKLWFTVKQDSEAPDTQSIVQIEETAGLIYLNGAAGTAGLGSITVTDAVAGDITIALDEAATAELVPRDCYYDVQVLTAAGAVTTLTAASAQISADITRATA